MAEPILSVKGLTKTFKLQGREDVRAVKDASFDLMPGECLGVIGESELYGSPPVGRGCLFQQLMTID